MALFRYHFLCAFALSTSGSLVAQQAQPTAAEVMARVAQHQDESEAERAHYLYVQHTKTSSRNGKTVMCEETTDYRIKPSPDGSHGELLKVEGRVLIDRQVVQYAALLPSDEDRRKEDEQARSDDNVEKDPKKAPPIQGGDGIDRNIVEHLRQNLLNDDSKDGISAHLFPLTSKAQTKYAFTLAGREHLNGRDVFDIKFRPKDKKDFGWQGDAYIDVDAYQPVLVTTDMARKIPFVVRTLLGTNLPGLGFNVSYAPQPDGLWFPVSFATEFKIDVFFFFRRTFILDAENRDFEKTHSETRILDDPVPVEPNQP